MQGDGSALGVHINIGEVTVGPPGGPPDSANQIRAAQEMIDLATWVIDRAEVGKE